MIVFFTTLLWHQFGRFEVISSAQLFVDHGCILGKDVEHAQILHDGDRSHWVLAYRDNQGVYVLDPLWSPDRKSLSIGVESHLERLFGLDTYTVLPCVQQEGAIMCGYFCLAMLYALNTGKSFPAVGQLKFDQDLLDGWLLSCADSRTMTMPRLLKEGGPVAKSRIVSPAEAMQVFHGRSSVSSL